MLKRILLMLALAMWIATPALAQDHTTAAPKAPVESQKGQTQAESHAQEMAEHAAAPGGAAAAGHDAAANGGHEKAELLPNPTKKETWLQALWVVIIFLVLLAVLYPTAWKNVLAGLKKREERIRKDIADAEATRAKAEATLKDYNAQLATAENKIRDMLAKATADGERLATNLKMQAQQESEEIKNRATREIEAAKDQALAEVYEKTAELATSVAEKIIRRNLNPEDQRDLVNRGLEQLQTVSKN